MAGDESIAAANRLEAALLEAGPIIGETIDLIEALALYVPGSTTPYVDAPELRRIIARILGSNDED